MDKIYERLESPESSLKASETIKIVEEFTNQLLQVIHKHLLFLEIDSLKISYIRYKSLYAFAETEEEKRSIAEKCVHLINNYKAKYYDRVQKDFINLKDDKYFTKPYLKLGCKILHKDLYLRDSIKVIRVSDYKDNLERETIYVLLQLRKKLMKFLPPSKAGGRGRNPFDYKDTFHLILEGIHLHNEPVIEATDAKFSPTDIEKYFGNLDRAKRRSKLKQNPLNEFRKISIAATRIASDNEKVEFPFPSKLSNPERIFDKRYLKTIS